MNLLCVVSVISHSIPSQSINTIMMKTINRYEITSIKGILIRGTIKLFIILFSFGSKFYIGFYGSSNSSSSINRVMRDKKQVSFKGFGDFNW
jgi:hypothetical protein